jgi:hypothetical protein
VDALGRDHNARRPTHHLLGDARFRSLLRSLVNLASTEHLRCPACGGKIAPAPSTLSCTQCRRSFPFDNGRPVLLDLDTVVMWANIAALDAETSRYTLVLMAIALLARVWLPMGA